MKKYFKNLKNTLVYSDSEMVDLIAALVLGFSNPFSMADLSNVPALWGIVTIMASLLLFIGVAKRSIRLRVLGTMFAIMYSFGVLLLEITEGNFDHNLVSYAIQLPVFLFTYWKMQKEVLHRSFKEYAKGRIEKYCEREKKV